MITVVVNSYNHGDTILACLDGILSQEGLSSPLEILLVDDGSTDTTVERATQRLSVAGQLMWKIHVFPQRGGVYCRQFGIDNAKHELCMLLGGDFILVEPTIISQLIVFAREDVGFASLYGPHGGMGTVYRKSLVNMAGGFDMAFNRFGSGYRDDSDLYYRLRDMGFQSFFHQDLQSAYIHRQNVHPGFISAIRYAIGRVLIHELDALLFKKHPHHFRADFPMILTFIVNPRWDYLRATGRWRVRDKIELSSPQGVVLVHGRNWLNRLFIRLCAAIYALGLIVVRIRGSIRYGTFLY